MSADFPPFDPAIRIVNSNGGIARSALRLGVNALAMDASGILLSKTSCRYEQKNLGPFDFADYAMRPSILGYRAVVELDFGQIKYNLHEPSGSGPGLLLAYYLAASLIVPSYTPLQFNLYANNEDGSISGVPSPWRGMWCSSDWDLDPLGAQSAGVAWIMKLYAAELIDAPGDWGLRTW